MADLIKKIKIKKQDGTYTDYIPIGVDAVNAITDDGESVQLKLNKKPYYYNTVADMKNAKLKEGDMAITLGYYEVDDGGAGEYKIEKDLLSNEMNIIKLNNGFYAKLIETSYYITANQFGAHCDGVSDDTTLLQNIINYCQINERELKIKGYAYVKNSIDTKGIMIVGEGQRPYPDHVYTSKKYGYIGWDYLRNINNGAYITFKDYCDDVLTSGSGIISDIANPVIKCYSDDGLIKLQNISIVGWIRNNKQVGIKQFYSNNNSYVSGKHYLDCVSVFNFGSNGIELASLELSEINNCDFSCNLGYGLYIEEDSTKDCPFEYVTFNQCYFRCNKLGGLKAKNSFRKSVIFENCFINRNGLYTQLDITPPDNVPSLVAGIIIEGRSLYDSVQHNQRILKLDNCHGEEQNLLIKIDVYNSGWIFNNITISNCSNYPSDNSIINALAYINTYYTKTLNYFNNYLNSSFNSLVLSDNNQRIFPNIVDKIFYDVYNYNPDVNISSKITVALKHQYKFNNLVIINVYGTVNADIPAYENLLTNVPKPITQLHPNLNIDGKSVRGSVYINGTVVSTAAITSGQTINIYLVYYTDYQG